MTTQTMPTTYTEPRGGRRRLRGPRAFGLRAASRLTVAVSPRPQRLGNDTSDAWRPLLNSSR